MNRCQPLVRVPMLAIGLAMLVPETQAATIPVDGSWVKLIGAKVSTLPTTRSPYTFPGGPWTLKTTVPVKLTVTDWLAAGDLFQVFYKKKKKNVLLGKGSKGTISGAYAKSPKLALGNPNFAHNSWILQPGTYSFIFRSSKFAPTYFNGSIAFKAERLTVPVPVPVPDGGGTVFLLGMAVAGIAGVRSILYSETGNRLIS